MLRTVNLHQFPTTGSPFTQLMYWWLFRSAWFPQAFLNHQLAHTLPRNPDSMHLAQLLVCQGRPKVLVFRLDQIQNPPCDLFIQPVITFFATPLAQQSLSSPLLVSPPQPFHLPRAQTQQVRRFFLGQPLFFQTLHYFQTCQFLCAHRDQFIHFFVPSKGDILTLHKGDSTTLR